MIIYKKTQIIVLRLSGFFIFGLPYLFYETAFKGLMVDLFKASSA